MLNWSLLEIEYLVLLPSLEATAARPRSALVAAPTRPLPRSARPSGTRGMYPPLGLQPISRAQTPCRMAAAISTTVEEKESCQFGHIPKLEEGGKGE